MINQNTDSNLIFKKILTYVKLNLIISSIFTIIVAIIGVIVIFYPNIFSLKKETINSLAINIKSNSDYTILD
jgi:hypothetical protein